MPTPEPERLLSSPVSRARVVHDLISAPDERVSRERVTRRVALLTGIAFVVAGLVKFVFHHWELHAFREFGLPWPSALEIFAGVLETAGGILLARRRAVVPAACLLGVTMVAAIISSGIGHGDVIPSLTLAPALLLATLFLLARGLGLGGTGQPSRRTDNPSPLAPAPGSGPTNLQVPRERHAVAPSRPQRSWARLES